MLLNDDFLLTTEWARRLFHDHAEKMPIIDYHCHLDPRQIYEDVHFSDLAQLWLYDNGAGDHYKWRLMRANGTPERLITGDGEPYEKFLAYVDTIERAPGNPLYEWSHLELRRAFGIDLTICRANADEIWRRANERIAAADFSAKGLIRAFDVRCVCTTDDPASDLAW
ncbi:glucuronate isomerase, partial [Thermophilibacter provencensis]